MTSEHISEESYRDANDVFFIICHLASTFNVKVFLSRSGKVNLHLRVKYMLFYGDQIKIEFSIYCRF
jgi:hypothetical protein